MFEYAGLVRSKTLLEQGLKYLGRLKRKVHLTLIARNGHELGRCFEVFNQPFTNPLLDKHLFIKKEDERPVFQWRERGRVARGGEM